MKQEPVGVSHATPLPWRLSYKLYWLEGDTYTGKPAKSNLKRTDLLINLLATFCNAE